jgi:hypothetical protein
MQKIARLIEFQNRRRGRTALRGRWSRSGMYLAGFQRSGAMNDPHMILGIHRHADGLAQNPMIGQRLGPQGIHFEARSVHSRACGALLGHVRPNPQPAERRYKRSAHVQFAFHVLILI